VAQLSARQRDFEKAGARVVLVGMGTSGECAAFQKKFNILFQMISDPDCTLYRQFHLQRMSPLGVFSPTVALRSIAAIAKGHTIGRPRGDVLQLPGVFVINSDGRIVFSHQPDNPASHPDPDTILEALAHSGPGRAPA
jgi:peroxiredoxin